MKFGSKAWIENVHEKRVSASDEFIRNAGYIPLDHIYTKLQN
jgi:hypothetical protein